MKLKKLVCRPEQAKKLYQLNIIQSSLFSYISTEGGNYHLRTSKNASHQATKDFEKFGITNKVFSAFSLGELFIMYEKDFVLTKTDDENQAELLAEKLIDAIENGIVTAEEINKRIEKNS